MKDCSNHKKEVAGISDMKDLANRIGDLHYETLADLLDNLSDKIFLDSVKDNSEGRKKLSSALEKAAYQIMFSSMNIYKAYDISKPFMDKKNKQS